MGYEPNKNIWQSKGKGGLKAYQQGLNQGVKSFVPGQIEPQFLTPAYKQVGQQQQQGMRSLRDMGGQAFGTNSSGLMPMMQSQMLADAPYGEARLAAEGASFNRFQQQGQGLMSLKDLEKSWYANLQSLQLQEEALGNQAAMAAAGGGGGLDLGGLGAGLGGFA